MPLLREKQLLAQGFKRKNGGKNVKTLKKKKKRALKGGISVALEMSFSGTRKLQNSSKS